MRPLAYIYFPAFFAIAALLIIDSNASPAGSPGQQARIKQSKALLKKEKAFCKAYLANVTTISTSSSPVRIFSSESTASPTKLSTVSSTSSDVAPSTSVQTSSTTDTITMVYTETVTDMRSTSTITTTSTSITVYTPYSTATITASPSTQIETSTQTSTSTITSPSSSVVTVTSMSVTAIQVDNFAKRGVPTQALQLLANVVSSKSRIKNPKFVIPYDDQAIRDACNYLLYGTQGGKKRDVPPLQARSNAIITKGFTTTITEIARATQSTVVIATSLAPNPLLISKTVTPDPITTTTVTTETSFTTIYTPTTTTVVATATASVISSGPGFIYVLSGPDKGKHIADLGSSTSSDPQYGFSNHAPSLFFLNATTSELRNAYLENVYRPDSLLSRPLPIAHIDYDGSGTELICQSDVTRLLCHPENTPFINRWYSGPITGTFSPSFKYIGNQPLLGDEPFGQSEAMTLLFVSDLVSLQTTIGQSST